MAEGDGICVWHQYIVLAKNRKYKSSKMGSVPTFKYGVLSWTIMPAQPRVTSCGEKKNQCENGREGISKWEKPPSISQCAVTSPEGFCLSNTSSHELILWKHETIIKLYCLLLHKFSKLQDYEHEHSDTYIDLEKFRLKLKTETFLSDSSNKRSVKENCIIQIFLLFKDV